MKDEFSKGLKIKSIECSIVNLDDSDGPGTHWVAYYNHPRLPYVLYFDSYGMPPPNQLAAYLLKAGKPLKYNSTQYQVTDSNACGYYCIFLLNQLHEGKPVYDVLYKQFDQYPSIRNETTVLFL